MEFSLFRAFSIAVVLPLALSAMAEDSQLQAEVADPVDFTVGNQWSDEVRLSLYGTARGAPSTNLHWKFRNFETSYTPVSAVAFMERFFPISPKNQFSSPITANKETQASFGNKLTVPPEAFPKRFICTVR